MTGRARAAQLHVTDMRLLHDWALNVRTLFGKPPYLVGSVLWDKDYRDVDIRLIYEDDRFDILAGCVSVQRLGFVVSLWGQRVTGLPIDFQIQRQTEANEAFAGSRIALGLQE